MDVNNLKNLLLSGKEEEAKRLLADFLSSSITPGEQAQALIDLATLHMDTQNALNREYLSVLQWAIQEVKEMSIKHQAEMDSLDLQGAREKLK